MSVILWNIFHLLRAARSRQYEFELHQRWVSVADGDKQVDDLHEYLIHFVVVRDAPVESVFQADGLCISECEQRSQSLAHIAVLNKDDLFLKCLLWSMPQFVKVYQAIDEQSALAFNPGLEPSLVLLDYEVARNGSSGTLTRFRAEWPQAVCLALADDENQYERAASSGADVVLMKGVPATKLLDTIAELLNA